MIIDLPEEVTFPIKWPWESINFLPTQSSFHENVPYLELRSAQLQSYFLLVTEMKRGWRWHEEVLWLITQDEIHLHLSGQTSPLVLTISHVRNSTWFIQFTSENCPVVQPSLTLKLTTSHHVSESYKDQFISLCYCLISDMGRPLSFMEYTSSF